MSFFKKSIGVGKRNWDFLKDILIFSLFLGVLVLSVNVAQANGLLNIHGTYPGVKPEGVSGAEEVVQYLKGNIYDKAKALLSPIMILLIAVLGIKLIVAGGKEEDYKKASQQFFYLLIGILFVFFAESLSNLFSIYSADPINDPSFLGAEKGIGIAAGKFSKYMNIIIKLARYVLGGVALFYVVKAGAIIIFNADEETVTKQKEVFIFGFVGFILIIVADLLVRTVFSVKGGVNIPFVPEKGIQVAVDVGTGLGVLTNATNLLLAVLSSLFLFTMVVGGVMYALSAGNEERGQKATKILVGSLIGLVIAFSSYTLVAEFSSGGNKVREAKVAEDIFEESRLGQPDTGIHVSEDPDDDARREEEYNEDLDSALRDAFK